MPGDNVCLFFPLEEYVDFLLAYKQKRDSKIFEVTLGCCLLMIFKKRYPDRPSLLGFPLKSKFREKYVGRTGLSNEEFANFLQYELKQDTLTDLVITEVKDGKQVNTLTFQVKRFGAVFPYKTESELIELLYSLRNTPSTKETLLIDMRHYGILTPIKGAYEALKDKDYPFKEVALIYLRARRSKIKINVVKIYPSFNSEDHDFDLEGGNRDSIPKVMIWYRDFTDYIYFSVHNLYYCFYFWILQKLYNSGRFAALLYFFPPEPSISGTIKRFVWLFSPPSKKGTKK